MSTPVRLTVTAPNPETHLFDVRAEIPDLGGDDHVDLRLPVWSPGSYKVRDYCRHVQEFDALGPDGSDRECRKVDKSTWRVDCVDDDRVVAEYRIYARELNVREKHLDETHGFFQPTALFVHPAGELDRSVRLAVQPPREDWSVYCGLESTDEGRWHAPDFHALYDAPVEMGDHDELDFEAAGADHRMVFWGDGNWDRGRLERDLPQIVETNADLFDDLPYEDYLFITLLSDGAYGGLEHRNSTSLLYENDEFGSPPDDGDEPPVDDDAYLNFLSLVAHEHFHAWNVKRVYPEAIEAIDYQAENYVPELWTIEGVTSYYDRLALRRAGIVDGEWLLDDFARRIRRLEQTPGRRLDSLEEAGFDAWIKLYQRDEHTANTTVSYYLKGALVAWLLDIEIRDRTDGAHSLDDLMRRLWSEFGPATDDGYPPGTHEALASELTGDDMTDFFDAFVRGRRDIDWEARLEPMGLTVSRSRQEEEPAARIGVSTRTDGDRLTVDKTPSDGPAFEAGISPGDELVAIDGWRLDSTDDLEERLQMFDPGDVVELHLFRLGRLVRREVELDEAVPDDYALRLRDDADDRQRRLLEDWLGTTDVPSTGDEEAT